MEPPGWRAPGSRWASWSASRCSLAHAWVGIRDVLMDYVKPLGARVGAMAVFALVFLASGLWALQAILSVGVR